MTESEKTIKLEELFGSFRAEWLRDELYSLFNEPEYFSNLTSKRSCVLIGGRGSGKTTALKCMSYEGQMALGKFDVAKPDFVGFYIKVNTNTVRSFDGPELEKSGWLRVFGHFLNITICEEIVSYISWLDGNRGNQSVASLDINLMGRSLGFQGCQSLSDLSDQIDLARINLEIYINNFGSEKPIISPLQSPISIFLTELSRLAGHKDTAFYIILDEYENLLDYQQSILNTLIKHGGNNYFFKVGVRELGWRVRSTLNESEALLSPADYERIHIEEDLKDSFADFAKKVCEARLRAADLVAYGPAIDVERLLPGLSTKDEAVRLGVDAAVSDFRAWLGKAGEHNYLLDLHSHELFVFLKLTNDDYEIALGELQRFAAREQAAVQKYDNYAYSLLFALAGKGRVITKYYCGHDVLSRITHRNIRFYMQLLNECIREQIQDDKSISEPIDQQLQTKAARQVGLKYLRELEGVSSQGALLAKLILGLGRVFQIMASNPVGGRPECNQFELKAASSSSFKSAGEVDSLLIESIMHMALVRHPGTKLTSEWDIRSWEYSVHPIFAPYFNFSHRQKRKMDISEEELLQLTQEPQKTIKQLLGRRSALADEALPEQMSMFDEYFR